jgi:DNA-binding winged helix-turn-helix (wHTH) protein/Tol biopolymer transport system component
MGESGQDSTIRFGVFELDMRPGELRKAGTRIKLQDQPLKVLIALLEQPGKVVTREELKHRIWPDDSFGDFDHGVNVAVGKLREALADSAGAPRFIETLPRRGYRFIFPVVSSREDRTGSRPAATIPSPPRIPLRAVVTAACAVVVLLVSIFVFKPDWIRPRPQKQLVQRDLTANPSDNPILASSISPDGQQLAYADLMTGLSLLQIDSGEKRFLSTVATLLPMSWYPDGTHLLLGGPGARGLWKMSVVDGTTRKLLEDKRGFVSAAVSPDGTRIAVVSFTNPGEIWIMGPDGEDPRRILSVGSLPTSVIFGLDWSPTSKRILYSWLSMTPDKKEESAIESCDREGGQRTPILSDNRLRGDGVSSVTWSSDRRVFFSFQEPPPNTRDSNIWSTEVDPDTGRMLGKPSRVTSGTNFSQAELSRSADGKRLVFQRIQTRDTIRLSEIESGGARLAKPQSLNSDNWAKWLDGWTSDGQALVFESNPQGKWGIFEQNVRTHEVRTLVSGPDRYDTPVASRDGQWLLFTQTSPGDTTGVSARLMRMPMNGGPATIVLPGKFDYACASKAAVCVLSEIANGQQIFSLLDPLQGRGSILGEIDNPTSEYSAWSLSSDGMRIAVLPGSDPGHIQIINTEGQGKNAVKLDGWSLQSVGWSPDNQHLYVSGISDASFKILLVGLDGNFKGLLELPSGQGWLTAPRPSPDGRYLAYFVQLYEHNVTLLENY